MKENENSVRVPYERLKSEFLRVLMQCGFEHSRADECASIFAENTLDGVNSHGINRFPAFVKNTFEGFIKPAAVPVLKFSDGCIEQWDGMLGPGPLNALFATDRAIQIAGVKNIGIVGLSNTNHWMRGGTYGWHAAKKGFVLICWTNTCRIMPAWGAIDPRLGNNPLVIAIPYHDEAIVIDFAMSQYSYGKLDSLKREGSLTEFPGGYDKSGNLTNDPAEILKTFRILPAGYWKGSGLSMMLDMLAAILSGGLSTHEVPSCGTEHAISQVFFAINIGSLPNFSGVNSQLTRIIEDLHKSKPVDPDYQVRYPGEHLLNVRKENKMKGILVNKAIWENLLRM
jgi:3-dehydro-L-gulonate 2-dehydrogenase